MEKSKSKKSIFSPSLITRVFFATFFSFVFSTLFNTLGNVIDGFIVGHTMSTADVSASSVTAPLWFFLAVIINLFSKGCQNYCADSLSRGKAKEAVELFSMTVITTVALGLLAFLIVLFFNAPITVLLGVDKNSAPYESCRSYMIGVAFGIPALTLITVLSSVLSLEGARKMTLYAILVMTVSDIVLDLATVYLLHGGMFLMGLSTSISYYAGAVVLVIYFLKNDVIFKFKFTKIKPLSLLKMCRVGLPMAVSRFTTSWKGTFINHMLAATAIASGFAAYNCQVQVNYITNAIFLGLAQTMGLMVCIFYAEENRSAIRRVVLMTLLLEVAFGVLCYYITFNKALIKQIAVFYLGGNTDAYDSAVPALGAFFGGLFGWGLAVLIANYLQSTKRIFMANIVYLLDDVLYVYLGVKFFFNAISNGGGSAEILTTGIFVGVLIAHMLFVFTVPLIVMIVNHRFVFGWDAILMLPKNFGTKPKNELNVSPTTFEEVVEFSKAAYDFCIEREVPKRKAYIVSLAAEELMKNTIEYGFEDNGKNRLEVLLVWKEDKIILRLRDNCRKFNPTKYYKEVYQNEDNMKNVGIRMIMELATDVSYTSTLKLNNLNVTV